MSHTQIQVKGSWKNKIVATTLADERAKCDFDQQEALEIIWRPVQISRLKEAADAMDKYPELANTHKFYDMTRAEAQKHWLKKTNFAYRHFKKEWFRGYVPGAAGYINQQLGQSPCSMHYMMFQTLLQMLSTEEQYQKWVPLSQDLRILGCYAQTEIGHGSDVAGLETTATYDIESDEFIIHTPSITATKWWPGDMGRNANHAVVFAQLIIDGNKYGVCPFIV